MEADINSRMAAVAFHATETISVASYKNSKCQGEPELQWSFSSLPYDETNFRQLHFSYQLDIHSIREKFNKRHRSVVVYIEYSKSFA